MRTYWYELLLNRANLTVEDWQNVLVELSNRLPFVAKWQIFVQPKHSLIKYFLCTKHPLPITLNLDSLLLKACAAQDFSSQAIAGLIINRWQDSVATIIDRLVCRQAKVRFFEFSFQSCRSKIICQATVTYELGSRTITKKLLLSAPARLLAVDFKKHQITVYRKIPKYTKAEKILPLLAPNNLGAILELQAYPYNADQSYLSLVNYNFNRHSFILGGSGVGKSKFIANLIHQIYYLSPQEYQVVLIDPHAALQDDLIDLPRTEINFVDLDHSINLFGAVTSNLHVSVELMLSLFKNLISDNYNSRLERVLRYTTYVLLARKEFSFLNLRQLILDLDYRNQLLATTDLPASVQQFFLTDFSELKSQAYNVAIAPIIAFIDEMTMLPVFNSVPPSTSLQDLLRSNFLNIFALDRLQLGDKVVQTIAGLLMQQLFSIAEQGNLSRHLIIIIDEVSVVENPILTRFLSELRKYNVSVILAGQYFAQITPNLQAAILANVTDYYIFRSAKADATILAQNLDIKLANSDDPDDQIKIITGLKHRECIVRIEHGEQLLPVFKARSCDLALGKTIPVTRLSNIENTGHSEKMVENEFDFTIDDVDIGAIMRQTSTSRKKLKD